LVRILADGFRLECREFTLEANPGTVDPGAIRSWRGAGVSRVSVGVQSFDDRVLRILGRGYSGREAQVFCQACRDAGFASLGLDLMTGVPGEPEEAAVKTLETALGLAPDHVSLYILEEVEGLPMAAVLEKTPVDEDAVAAAHATISSGLEAAGLRRYEISNFARPGRECLHNLKYWRYEPFLGLGPSACSHLQSRRWCNVRGIDRWADALIRGADTREEDVVLSAAEEAREALIFGLRLVEGVDLEGLRARFGVDLANLFRAEIAALRHDGLLVRHGSGLRIPVEKLLISNLVFSKFV
jgi:oxygen-independent coproporphyrinogen-3 oxidase